MEETIIVQTSAITITITIEALVWTTPLVSSSSPTFRPSLDLVRTRGLRLHHRPYSTDPVSSELTPRTFTTLDQNVVEGGHYGRSDPFFEGGEVFGQSRDSIRYLTLAFGYGTLSYINRP
jgi:hypothetical protein